MAKEIGRLTGFGIGIESSTGRGTARAAQIFYPLLDRSFGPKSNKVINTSSRGRIEDADSADIAEIWSEGNIEAKVLLNKIPYIFKSLFGTIVTSTGTTGEITDVGVKNHAITVAQSSQHTSLTFSIDDPAADKLYTNGMVGTFEMTAEAGEYVKFTAELIATQGATGTVTPVYVDDWEFTSKDVSIKMAATTTGFTAATAIPCKSLSLTINPNIERELQIGSTDPNDILNKQFSVEGEFELVLTNETYRDLVEASTDRAIQIKLENSATGQSIPTSTGTDKPLIQFTMPKCQVTEHDVAYPNDDFVTETIKFKALYDSSTGVTETISVKVHNTTTSYTT